MVMRPPEALLHVTAGSMLSAQIQCKAERRQQRAERACQPDALYAAHAAARSTAESAASSCTGRRLQARRHGRGRPARAAPGGRVCAG